MLRCKIKGCRGFDTPKVVCNNNNCAIEVHPQCFPLLKDKTAIPNDFETVVCSKRCYNAFVKSQNEQEQDTNKQRRNRWHNDGTTMSKGKSSMEVLLDWLSVEGNYDRFKGGGPNNNRGETKRSVCSEISCQIKKSGISVTRKWEDVWSKILYLERSYKEAKDARTSTGYGSKDGSSLKKTMKKDFIYYDILSPIFENRPSVTPLYTTNDLEAASVASTTKSIALRSKNKRRKEENNANNKNNDDDGNDDDGNDDDGNDNDGNDDDDDNTGNNNNGNDNDGDGNDGNDDDGNSKEDNINNGNESDDATEEINDNDNDSNYVDDNNTDDSGGKPAATENGNGDDGTNGNGNDDNGMNDDGDGGNRGNTNGGTTSVAHPVGNESVSSIGGSMDREDTPERRIRPSCVVINKKRKQQQNDNLSALTMLKSEHFQLEYKLKKRQTEATVKKVVLEERVAEATILKMKEDAKALAIDTRIKIIRERARLKNELDMSDEDLDRYLPLE